MEGNSVLVKDAMSKNAITAKAGDLVADIAKIMVEREIGGVIIVDDDMFPIGIVTEGDIVRNLVAKKMDLEDTVAKDIMTTPVITITDDIELSAAARLMAARHIKKLCIVDLDGKLKGLRRIYIA